MSEPAWFGWFRGVGGRLEPAIIRDFITKEERAKAAFLRDLAHDEKTLRLDDLVARYPKPETPHA